MKGISQSRRWRWLLLSVATAAAPALAAGGKLLLTGGVSSIARHFKREGRDNLIKQLTDQLCQVSGGPRVYGGAPMDKTHRDLDITKADFNALVEVLQASMNAKGVPFRAQNAMLARLAPMHRQIVSAD